MLDNGSYSFYRTAGIVLVGVLCVGLMPFTKAHAENVLPSLQKKLEACYAPYEKRQLQEQQEEAQVMLDQFEQSGGLERLNQYTRGLEELTKSLPTDGSTLSLDKLGQFSQQSSQLARDTDVESIFSKAPEERKAACEKRRMSSIKSLPVVQNVKACYQKAIQEAGLSGDGLQAFLAAGASEEELRAFSCDVGDGNAALQTKVSVPAGAMRSFKLKTFCIDGGRSGPDNGHPYTVLGAASKVGRKDLANFLKTAAQEPGKASDIQESIWEEDSLLSAE